METAVMPDEPKGGSEYGKIENTSQKSKRVS
jgi:hypothetical protein